MLKRSITSVGIPVSSGPGGCQEDAQAQSAFWRGTLVGQVDEKSAMIATEVIDQAAMTKFFQANGQRFADLGVAHEIYALTPIA
jgi:hypothetical protein